MSHPLPINVSTIICWANKIHPGEGCKWFKCWCCGRYICNHTDCSREHTRKCVRFKHIGQKTAKRRLNFDDTRSYVEIFEMDQDDKK